MRRVEAASSAGFHLLREKQGFSLFSVSSSEQRECPGTSSLPAALPAAVQGGVLASPAPARRWMIYLSSRPRESLAASSFPTFAPFQTPWFLLASSQDTINLNTKKTEVECEEKTKTLRDVVLTMLTAARSWVLRRV